MAVQRTVREDKLNLPPLDKHLIPCLVNARCPASHDASVLDRCKLITPRSS